MAKQQPPKTALVLGMTGQDGAYLAQLLLRRGYRVVGGSRDAARSDLTNLERVGVVGSVELISLNAMDFRSVLQALTRIAPAEIYHLSGQSSVGLSFEQPVETLETVATSTLNLLECIRYLAQPTRLYVACSGESFGPTDGPADELTPFRPRSPYGVAKSTAYWLTANYRAAYKLFACSGILFNHESPLRHARFVTRKIASAAARAALGQGGALALGNIGVRRDWGWAPEYVEAMWRMLQIDAPEDFVIATGEPHSIGEFAEACFAHVGKAWRDAVTIDSSLFRPHEIPESCGNASKAARVLGWRPTIRMPDVARLMVEAELALLKGRT